MSSFAAIKKKRDARQHGWVASSRNPASSSSSASQEITHTEPPPSIDSSAKEPEPEPELEAEPEAAPGPGSRPERLASVDIEATYELPESRFVKVMETQVRGV